MRKFFLVLTGFLICCAGCSRTPQEKALVLVNTGAVNSDVVEKVRQWMVDQLHVPVRIQDQPKLAVKTDVESLKKAALKKKHPEDVVYIVLTSLDNETNHLTVFESDGLAIINVAPLETDDGEIFYRRVERQAMRAAAFAFGMPPTPDPYCVTRDYNTVEELDKMGRNYSPPWQMRYAKEAAARGLQSVGTGVVAQPPVPEFLPAATNRVLP